jgi:hypothetical protein
MAPLTTQRLREFVMVSKKPEHALNCQHPADRRPQSAGFQGHQIKELKK